MYKSNFISMNLTPQMMLTNASEETSLSWCGDERRGKPLYGSTHHLKTLATRHSKYFLIVRVKSIDSHPDSPIPGSRSRITFSNADFHGLLPPSGLSKPRISTSLVPTDLGRLANSYNPGTSHSSMLYWKAGVTISAELNFTES